MRSGAISAARSRVLAAANRMGAHFSELECAEDPARIVVFVDPQPEFPGSPRPYVLWEGLLRRALPPAALRALAVGISAEDISEARGSRSRFYFRVWGSLGELLAFSEVYGMGDKGLADAMTASSVRRLSSCPEMEEFSHAWLRARRFAVCGDTLDPARCEALVGALAAASPAVRETALALLAGWSGGPEDWVRVGFALAGEEVPSELPVPTGALSLLTR